jgi:cysteine synthase
MRVILDTIGNTPLIEVDGIFAKLETFNPTGSVKDRIAWYIIRNAEKRGELKPGQKILEITSGNTGIALSMVAAIRDYKFIAVMPESMSLERRKMMGAFGAEIVLTPSLEDMDGALRKYDELVKENPDAFLPKQFENPDNIKAHEFGLGKEIVDEVKVDAFVVGTGTGGTLVGVARALRRRNPNVKIIAVEPAESAVISGEKQGLHKIQGIGEGFIPKIVSDNLHLIDEVIKIKSDDAIIAGKKLARKHGVLVGISSGANFLAAKFIKEKYGLKNVVTIFADRGERYLSM